MQLNEGRFMINGRCGYVLQPKFMKHVDYDPLDINTWRDAVCPIVLEINVSTTSHTHDVRIALCICSTGFHARSFLFLILVPHFQFQF